MVTKLCHYQSLRSSELSLWLNTRSHFTHNDHFNLVCEEFKAWVQQHLSRYPHTTGSMKR